MYNDFNMGNVSQVNPNRLIEQMLNEVDQFAVKLETKKATPKQVIHFANYLQKQIDQLASAPIKGKVNLRMDMQFQRLEKSVSSLIRNSRDNAPHVPTKETANYGNVLMGILKQIGEVRYERQIFRQKNKVTKVEESEFLNSTEKEFNHFVKDLTDKKKKPSEIFIIEFIKKLSATMSQLKILAQEHKTLNVKKHIDPECCKKIRSFIEMLHQDKEITQRLASVGKEGNAHLRLWQLLKKFNEHLNDYERSFAGHTAKK